MSQDTITAMEAPGAAEPAASDPDFIVYLLDPEQEYNCYFVVGNSALGKTEKIGVVKKMLLAHSVVLRAELKESKLAEKNDVLVKDLFPSTFKNLLRYVYGFDNTETLTFDEADNLLYAAEKYMMPKLKNKLAILLMSLLDYSNICSLMNNPACYTVLELNNEITEILQLETEKVLASPQFMDLSSSGFLKILEQEIANTTEIELWRAALKWARNRGGSENGQVLRNELTDHIQQIRVCTLSDSDILKEVIPTRVLTYDELVLVGESRRTGEVQPNLTTICNVIKERELPIVKSELLELCLTSGITDYGNIRNSTLRLSTKGTAIELCSVQLYSSHISAHHCNCTVRLERDLEAPIIVRFEGQIDSATGWSLPILNNEKNVQLLPNSSYVMQFTFSCSSTHNGFFTNNHSIQGGIVSVNIQRHSYNIGYYISHVSKILYKTCRKRERHAQTIQ